MGWAGLAGIGGRAEGLVDLLAGRTLGPYELYERLGAGGMGVVYRAVHRRLNQPRAVKVLPDNLAADPLLVERFEREARLAAELRHPHIVPIYDVGDHDGGYYIAMELLEGRALRQLILEDAPLPLDRCVRLLRQLAEALDFAHRRGVAHRDVKPGNVFVGPGDHVTLVDFGIARAVEDSRLTQTGGVVGTSEYMSPEVARGGEHGMGSDLYALGIVAYELATGRVPFTEPNSAAIMQAQIHTPPPPPRRLRADLPQAGEEVILRQLAKDPADRFASATAFVDALAAAIERRERGPVPTPSPTPAPSGGESTAWIIRSDDERASEGRPHGVIVPPPPTGGHGRRRSGGERGTVPTVGGTERTAPIDPARAATALLPDGVPAPPTGERAGRSSVRVSRRRFVAGGAAALALAGTAGGLVLGARAVGGPDEAVQIVRTAGERLLDGGPSAALQTLRDARVRWVEGPRLIGHSGDLRAIRFSPDGRTIASTGRDNTVRLWRVADGTLLQKLDVPGVEFGPLAFSPDNSSVAAGSSTGQGQEGWRVVLIDVASSSVRATIDGLHRSAEQLAFSPTEPLLAICHYDSAVSLYRLEPAGPVLQRMIDVAGGYAATVRFSPDGQPLAVGTGQTNFAAGTSALGPALRMCVVADGQIEWTLPWYGGPVSVLTFAPDGQTIIANASGSLQFFRPPRPPSREGSGPYSLDDRGALTPAFSEDGATLIAGAGNLRYWRMSGNGFIQTRTIKGPSGWTLDWSRDWQTVATKADSFSSTIQTWRMA